MGVLAFDEAAADQLMTALEQAQDRIQHQDQQRTAAVEAAIEDFAGPYAQLFTQTVDTAATDSKTLVFALLNLETQVNLARIRAQEEQRRLDDLAAWDALTEPTFLQRLTKPSETPHPRPTISADFSASSRVRTVAGGSESVSSARPNRLRGFVATARICNRMLAEELSALRSAWSAFRSSCSWVDVDSFTLLSGFEDYLQQCEINARWIDYVADAFEVAGTGVGVLNSVLNGLVFSALAPAMSDQQLLDALASKDELELTLLFNRSPALVNQLQLMDPVAINDWWNTMSATGHTAQQDMLLKELPELFGNLEGLPYHARAQANAQALQNDITFVAEEIDALEQLMKHQPEDHHGQRLAELEELAGILNQLETLSTHDFNGSATSLVSYTFDEPPLAALALGDLDTSSDVTYNVAGMGSSTKDMYGWTNASGNLHDSIAGARDDVATVAWLDYEAPPMAPGSLAVLGNRHAKIGGDRFAKALRGVDAVRRDDPPQKTVVGHSYGTPTMAFALADPRVHVEDAVMLASPGMPNHIRHVSDLNADNVYAGKARDIIPVVEELDEQADEPGVSALGFEAQEGDAWARLGREASIVRHVDPMDPAFGATRFGVDTNTEEVGSPVTTHKALANGEGNGHFDQGTEAMDNVGYAVNQQLDELSPYIPREPTPIQQDLIELHDRWEHSKDLGKHIITRHPVPIPPPITGPWMNNLSQ